MQGIEKYRENSPREVFNKHLLNFRFSHFQHFFHLYIPYFSKWLLGIFLLKMSFMAEGSAWQTVTKSDQYVESKVKSVIFTCPGNLVLIPSDENGISFSVPPAEGDTIEYLVSGNTLNIRLKNDPDKQNGIYKNNNGLTVLVQMKLLENIVFWGSGKIEIKNFIGKTLTCVWNGSGNFSGNVDYEKIFIFHKGSGRMELSGKTNDFDLVHAGTGDVFAKKLRIINGIVTLTGTGDIFVSVTGQLTATLGGTGNIYYYKNPKIKKSITGWGSIAKRMEAMF